MDSKVGNFSRCVSSSVGISWDIPVGEEDLLKTLESFKREVRKWEARREGGSGQESPGGKRRTC
jgi:hypothetical protein